MNPSIRHMTPNDVSAMADVGVDAYALDPQWNYRFPAHAQHKDEAHRFMRERFTTELTNIEKGASTIMVVEVDEGETRKVVGFAMYINPGWIVKKEGRDNYISSTPSWIPAGANAARMAVMREAHNRDMEEVFNKPYGDNQLHLGLLYVHPTYHGRGLGRLLLNDGLEHGREGHVPVTLFASPMGARIYLKEGFREVGALEVKLENDQQGDGLEEGIRYPGMIWEGWENKGGENR